MILRPGIVAARPAASGYVPQGVHFDGATRLINAALASSDNLYLTFAFWMLATNAAQSNTSPTIWVSDPVNQFSSYMEVDNLTGTGTFAIGTFTTGYNIVSANPTVIDLDGVWHSYICSGQNNTILQIYKDDIDITGTPGTAGSAINLQMNGNPLWVGDDGNGDQFTGDLADFYLNSGAYLDLSVVANRRKFIDANGKPVYLGANGELPTGTAPAVFLSASPGNALSFGDNKGPGGPFVWTGVPTLSATNP